MATSLSVLGRLVDNTYFVLRFAASNSLNFSKYMLFIKFLSSMSFIKVRNSPFCTDNKILKALVTPNDL